MKVLLSTEFELAGIPMVARYRLYRDDDIRFEPVVQIEIEDVAVIGTDIKVDLDYAINRDTIGAHIESIIVEH